MSGYYEWQATPGGKQPWYFTARDGSPALTIAGLWDEWKDRATGETLRSCTMIITEPNDFVAEVHDRMPVVLEPKGFRLVAERRRHRSCSSPRRMTSCSAGRYRSASTAQRRRLTIRR